MLVMGGGSSPRCIPDILLARSPVGTHRLSLIALIFLISLPRGSDVRSSLLLSASESSQLQQFPTDKEALIYHGALASSLDPGPLPSISTGVASAPRCSLHQDG